MSAGQRPKSGAIMAALAFAVTAAALRPLVPEPDDFAVTDKLAYYAAHVEDYDAVIVGSSRIYRGFVPEVLEPRLTALGHPYRFFNMAGPGLGGFEQERVLDEVLRLGRDQLELVVIEERGWSPYIPPWNRRTQRAVVWHDPITTARVLAVCAREDAPLLERLALARMHLNLLGLWIGNFGQGARTVQHLLGRAPGPIITAEELAADAGYRSLEAEARSSKGVAGRRTRFLEQLEQYEQDVRLLLIQNRQAGDPERYDRASLARQVAAVTAIGAEVVHVLPPGLEGTPTVFALDSLGDYPMLLPFNRPERFPLLYKTSNRFDDEHLTDNGARIFSSTFTWTFHERLTARED